MARVERRRWDTRGWTTQRWVNDSGACGTVNDWIEWPLTIASSSSTVEGSVLSSSLRLP